MDSLEMLTKKLILDGKLEHKGIEVPRPEELDLPKSFIQIGEGKFMRGFVDWMINQANKQGGKDLFDHR